MFDVGFWELAIIAVVALLVVGPERLPGVARTGGLWAGRLRRFVLTVKADIEQELHLEEAQKLAKRAESSTLHDIFEEHEEPVGLAEKAEQADALEDGQNKDDDTGSTGSTH